MANSCYLCEKSNMAGRSVQHKHSVAWRYKAPKSKRVFKPNLRNIDVEIDNKILNVSICMKCYKRLRKDSAEE